MDECILFMGGEKAASPVVRKGLTLSGAYPGTDIAADALPRILANLVQNCEELRGLRH
jgi:hypothetical protein